MRLSSISLALNRPGAVATLEQQVAALFAAGEQGAWYDPSAANVTWRRNRLTYTQEFDNAAWTKTNILAFGSGSIANATTAPDGTVTADKLVESSDVSNVTHEVNHAAISLAAVPYTYSVYAKAAERSWIAISIQGNYTFFNVTAGAGGVGVNAAGNTPNIVALPNGWYRCEVTRTATAANNFGLIRIASGDNTVSYTGDGTSGIYIWGAQLNLGSTAMSYQRIAATPTLSTPPTYATTSTMGGEVFRPYLWFDGADILQTATFATPTTDKAVVCAGVNRQTTTTYQFLHEYSASVASNNGSFAMLVDSEPNAPYVGAIKGTNATIDRATATQSSLVTQVLSQVYDLAGASADAAVDVRINKVVSDITTLSGTTPGGGNWGSYAFFVGARTNLPTSATINAMTGFVWGLVLRMAATSAAELDALENYQASKAGVTL